MGKIQSVVKRTGAIVPFNPERITNAIYRAAIAVGGDRNGGQEPTLSDINDFYLINEMIPVAGGSFGANLGAAVWSRDKGADGVREDAEGMAAIHRVVDRLMRVARILKGGSTP